MLEDIIPVGDLTKIKEVKITIGEGGGIRKRVVLLIFAGTTKGVRRKPFLMI